MAQANPDQFNIKQVRQKLLDDGWAVVDNVISSADCDRLIQEYQQWLKQFGEAGPDNIRSIIHKYNVGHLRPLWEVRLKTKAVYSALWGTEKLLTSFDGIAIGEPPEEGRTMFAIEDKHNLHLDQGPRRIGLHGYQGSVYLEPQAESDWCFQVLSGSHKHFENFWKLYKPGRSEFRKLTDKEVTWYKREGCKQIKIPAGKGSIILWDSRLVHDGSLPVEGRENAGKWRFVNFVSMSPAIWATEADMQAKREHFSKMATSRHWSSTGVSAFKVGQTKYDMKALPDIANTQEALLLAGVEQYDFDDGKSNGPRWLPQWA